MSVLCFRVGTKPALKQKRGNGANFNFFLFLVSTYQKIIIFVLINLKQLFILGAKIETAIIGLSGAGGIEVVDQVATLNPAVITDGVGLVSQIVILIVTLIGLFKKKKVTQNQN